MESIIQQIHIYHIIVPVRKIDTDTIQLSAVYSMLSFFSTSYISIWMHAKDENPFRVGLKPTQSFFNFFWLQCS